MTDSIKKQDSTNGAPAQTFNINKTFTPANCPVFPAMVTDSSGGMSDCCLAEVDMAEL